MQEPLHKLSFVLLAFSTPLTAPAAAFQLPHALAPRSPLSVSLKAYGKGSEIWPECNEDPISLSASFPGGNIPQVALDMLDSIDTTPAEATTTELVISQGKRKAIKRTISHLLSSAAKASSRRASRQSNDQAIPAVIDKSPILLATLLVILNCVTIKHIASAIGLTLYLIGMACWCATPTKRGQVKMPSLPLKGHVPNLLSNPLGNNLSHSKYYRIWLRLGALLSILLPMVALSGIIWKDFSGGWGFSRDAFNNINLSEPMHGVMKKLIGGHVFLVCWQALSESVGRAALLPLPIRILIPVSYNTLRLSSLHDWAWYPSILLAGEKVLSPPLRLLGIANLIYWYVNLMVFLPVAVVSYLRAHFYCVEATEVVVREGNEGAVGLLT